MNRTSLARAGSAAAASTLLALQLMAGVSIAAVPLATATAIATPSTVSPGDVAGYVVTYRNDDSSTISKVALTATMSDGFAYAIQSVSTSAGSCKTTAPLSCSLGNVKPGQTVTIVVGLTTSSASASVTTTFDFSSGGSTPSDGGTSHGDSWFASATTSLSSDPNFRGRFIAKSTQQTVENLQTLSATNPHATKVVAPVTLIPVTVQDGPATALACGGVFTQCPGTAFGETSSISVDGGRTFTSPFRVIVSFDSSEIPSGVNQGNIKVYHQWSDASGTGEQLIAARCVVAKGASTPSNAPCVTVKKLPGNDLEVTVWTFHNGSMKGYN